MELTDTFVKNRAEEIGYDVWSQFVVPPFFDTLELRISTKPCLVIGGRGSGKTMLLRYLSHQSAFSPDRPAVPASALERIGLYWKADTQFAHTLSGRGVSNETWEAAFDHAMALKLAGELLDSLSSIARSRCESVKQDGILKLAFSDVRDFASTLGATYIDLRASLHAQWRAFQTWANNPRKLQEPVFLPCREFLMALIAEIRAQVPALANSVFLVFIDEYENLREYQRRIINTHLKHSELPLLFNIAAKRNAVNDRGTLGQESITHISDFRQIFIDERVSEDFPLFAAEIMFLKLAVLAPSAAPVEAAQLQDPNRLGERRRPEYRARVLQGASRLFPSLSTEDLARQALADGTIRRQLEAEIAKSLKRRGGPFVVADFVRNNCAQASIVSSALLNRDALPVAAVKEAYDRHARGEDSKFDPPTDWLHNNFVGCLLRLYDLCYRVCPFYGGFESFCLLSRGNQRHFLELCHKSLRRGVSRQDGAQPSVPTADQAQAALQASSDFLHEVRSFGPSGNALHTFVLTLGSLFALAHERPTQSEPEMSHFAIVGGVKQLGPADHEFLNEAVKWSVLFEERETKLKSDMQPYGVQWVLNPIYAPYFRITYRKIRKLELTTDQLLAMIRGSYDDRARLLRSFQSHWELTESDLSPTLFSHLQGEQQ